MTYLLDTNVCITYLRTFNSPIRRRLAMLSSADIALCAVVKVELVYGAQRSADPPRSLTELSVFFAPYVSFPFDDVAAMIAGHIRADLAALGTPISANDVHIAAIALAHDLTLVTHNTREFARVLGLRLEDWEAIP